MVQCLRTHANHLTSTFTLILRPGEKHGGDKEQKEREEENAWYDGWEQMSLRSAITGRGKQRPSSASGKRNSCHRT